MGPVSPMELLAPKAGSLPLPALVRVCVCGEGGALSWDRAFLLCCGLFRGTWWEEDTGLGGLLVYSGKSAPVLLANTRHDFSGKQIILPEHHESTSVL